MYVCVYGCVSVCLWLVGQKSTMYANTFLLRAAEHILPI